jgi:hypothetical protein
MAIFSDDVHDWAIFTYEVFVPARLQRWIYTHTTELLVEDTSGGELLYTIRRGTNAVLHANFVPDRLPRMQYDVPLEILETVRRAESCEAAEDALTYAGQHAVLIEDDDTDEDD